VKIFTRLNQIGDQGQSQTLAVATRPVIERVVSNPSGLYMSNFERPSLIPQHYSPYDSRDTINKLRAGGSRLTEVAWLFLTIWMLNQQNNVESFSVKPPHHQLVPSVEPRPPHGGTYGSSQSNFSQQMAHKSQQNSSTKEEIRNQPTLDDVRSFLYDTGRLNTKLKSMVQFMVYHLL
jgi:hypothetical protein